MIKSEKKMRDVCIRIKEPDVDITQNRNVANY